MARPELFGRAKIAALLLAAGSIAAAQPGEKAIPPVPPGQAQIVFLRESKVNKTDAAFIFETGSGAPEEIVTLDVTPSMVAHRCTVFLATELSVGEPARDPSEQGMRSAWFTRTEIDGMIRDGHLVDAKSIAALTLLSLSAAM